MIKSLNAKFELWKNEKMKQMEEESNKIESEVFFFWRFYQYQLHSYEMVICNLVMIKSNCAVLGLFSPVAMPLVPSPEVAGGIKVTKLIASVWVSYVPPFTCFCFIGDLLNYHQ